MKLCFLDFEFNGVSEPRLNIVSVAAVCTENTVEKYRREFWLYSGPQRKDVKEHQGGQARGARDFFRRIIAEGYTFVAYVMEAEARSLLSLFGEDRAWLNGFKAIDLYLEYRNLLNHNHALAYGPQYVDGKIIVTKPPVSKWMREEDDKDQDLHHKPQFSLAAACYKILGVQIDTVEKKTVRDIIIEGHSEKLVMNMDRIQKYNMSDIQHLPRLLTGFLKWHLNQGIEKETWLAAAYARGEYAVRTALMLQLGYPINADKVARFTSNVKEILTAAAKDCLETAPETQSFRFDKRQQKYVANEKTIRQWVSLQGKPFWRKTAGKKVSISKDAFADWYDSSSPGFAGAYCRYLKTKQSLNGFVSSKSTKKGKFSDFVGVDGRVRPYFGIYGSQSSRSQPGAVGFIPLKAHWMRNFIEAPQGRALAGIDYASQEFLIAAIISQDSAMMQAYASGDVYLAFAKEVGLVPQDATRATHGAIRDRCKTLVLGISYDMSPAGLAARMGVDEDEAEKLVKMFFEVYVDYKEWKDRVLQEYEENNYLMLPDGWVMWGDNDNRRSVANFPIQGHGAVIMRKAVAISQSAGLDVVFTLHDALYIEFPSGAVDRIKALMAAMSAAFEIVMKPYGEFVPIRLEGEAWSRDYVDKLPEPIENVIYLPEYHDKKGAADLERYRPFFT